MGKDLEEIAAARFEYLKNNEFSEVKAIYDEIVYKLKRNVMIGTWCETDIVIECCNFESLKRLCAIEGITVENISGTGEEILIRASIDYETLNNCVKRNLIK